MSSTPEKTIVAIDGTDALAYVILRPGKNASGVMIEAAANGISKPYAAYALRHTAQSWDPDNTVGADVGQQLKAALASIDRITALAAELDTESPWDANACEIADRIRAALAATDPQ